MAGADYWLCDLCGAKAFYDANLNYDDDNPERHDGRMLPGHNCGDAQVLCIDCAKTHRVIIVKQEEQRR